MTRARLLQTMLFALVALAYAIVLTRGEILDRVLS